MMNRHGLGQIMSIKNGVVDRFRTGKIYQFLSLIIKIVINNLVLFAFDVIVAGIGILLSLIEFYVIKSTMSPIKEIFLFYLLLTPLFLYLLSGYLLLPTKYIFTDFISVILYGLIGIMIWVNCINHPTQDVLSSPWWGYLFYTTGMAGVYDFPIGNFDPDHYWRILYSIIPVLFSFCGLEIKRIYNKKDLDFVIILKFIFKKIRNTTPIYL